MRVLKQIAIGLSAVLALTAPAAAERLTASGTGVSIDVPEGYQVATAFAGFQNPATQSSILVTELPVEAYAEVFPVFNNLEEAKAALAAQQVVIETTETITGGTLELLVLHGEQSVGALVADKWIALAQTDKTLLLTLNLLGGETEEQVRAMLASLEVAAPPSLEEQLATLPYAATPEAPFTVPATLMGSTISFTTLEGPDPTGLLPRIIIAWQISGGPVSDTEAVALELLSSMSSVGEVQVVEGVPATFAGVEGTRHVGTYDHDGEPMQVVQYTAILGGQFIRLVATLRASEAATLLPIVDRVASSVRTQ